MACKAMWIIYYTHTQHLKWIQLQFEMNTICVWYVPEIYTVLYTILCVYCTYILIYRFLSEESLVWTSNLSSICVDSVCVYVCIFSALLFSKQNKKVLLYNFMYCFCLIWLPLLFVSNKNIFVALPFLPFAIFFYSQHQYVSFVLHTSVNQLKKNKLLAPFAFHILLLPRCLPISVVHTVPLLLLSLFFSLLVRLYLSHRNALSFERINVEQSAYSFCQPFSIYRNK